MRVNADFTILTDILPGDTFIHYVGTGGGPSRLCDWRGSTRCCSIPNGTKREYSYYRCSRYGDKGHPRVRLTEQQIDQQLKAFFAKSFPLGSVSATVDGRDDCPVEVVGHVDEPLALGRIVDADRKAASAFDTERDALSQRPVSVTGPPR